MTTTRAPRAARRRLISIGLPTAGFAVAVAYGVLIADMSFGSPLVVLGLGGMTLILTALALFRTLDPLLRPDGEDRSLVPQAPARLRELEREKQLVLKAIREIELDYQMRKIAENDYKEMVQRYRTRAMRIIRELDAGENYKALIEQELKTRMEAVASAEKVAP